MLNAMSMGSAQAGSAHQPWRADGVAQPGPPDEQHDGIQVSGGQFFPRALASPAELTATRPASRTVAVTGWPARLQDDQLVLAGRLPHLERSPC